MGNRKKGVLTVEAALVMPIVIYVVFIMIFMFILIYSKIYVSLSVDHVVSEVTAQWYSRGSDFDTTTKKGYNSIIAEAFASATSTKAKVQQVQTKLDKRVKEGVPMKIDFKSNVNVSSYIVGQTVNIKTETTFQLPLAGLYKFFGITTDGKIKQESYKVVNVANNEGNMRLIKYSSDLVKKKAGEILAKIKKKFKF